MAEDTGALVAIDAGMPEDAGIATPSFGEPATTVTLAAGAADQQPITQAKADIAKAVTTDFPADWRQKLAGEDKTVLKQLERFADPAAMFKSYRSLLAQLSSGELKAVKSLPENATLQQLAEWRQEQGIPETPQDYVAKLMLPGGMVPGETDQPLLDSFAQHAHALHWRSEQFNQAVAWHFEMQDLMAAQRAQTDQMHKLESRQSLVGAMGGDFKANMNALKGFWASAPAGVDEIILTARAQDGRIIGNIPEVVSFFAENARELNPASTLLPGSEAPHAIATRKAEIEAMMYLNGKPNPAYWGTTLEKEYRDLIEAEQRNTRAG